MEPEIEFDYDWNFGEIGRATLFDGDGKEITQDVVRLSTVSGFIERLVWNPDGTIKINDAGDAVETCIEQYKPPLKVVFDSTE
jgi:hypothetical protein